MELEKLINEYAQECNTSELYFREWLVKRGYDLAYELTDKVHKEIIETY